MTFWWHWYRIRQNGIENTTNESYCKSKKPSSRFYRLNIESRNYPSHFTSEHLKCSQSGLFCLDGILQPKDKHCLRWISWADISFLQIHSAQVEALGLSGHPVFWTKHLYPWPRLAQSLSILHATGDAGKAMDEQKNKPIKIRKMKFLII
jgi:hypothetical protein